MRQIAEDLSTRLRNGSDIYHVGGSGAARAERTGRVQLITEDLRLTSA